MGNKQAASVVDTFERALGDIRTRVCVSADSSSKIAIAYSGGLDSSALLHLAHAYAATHGVTLYAFHIHHGLSPHADDWLAHCRSESERLGIGFDARRVEIAQRDKSGVEEAARLSRYMALGDLCRLHRVPLLLTAHHLDDQAETVLLQLMRGSGVAGMSGMDGVNAAPDLLGDERLLMGRPLLAVARTALADLVADRAIAYVDDESNLDTRYARNALRHKVMPILAEYFPGFQQRFARTAQHAQAAQRMLVELGAQDLALCLEGESLDISRIRQLSPDRIDNLLRYWFGSRGVRMPSTAWLNEMRTQLLEAKADAQLCVTHADCHIRRHRDRVFLTPRLEGNPADMLPQSFRWSGEEQMHFADYRGVLHFAPAEQGLDADWLRNTDLQIHYRQGGERLKPALNRPTKGLKHHYQALDIPAWERERLPLVSAGKDLLFAAGIGMDCHHVGTGSGSRICLRWQADAA